MVRSCAFPNCPNKMTNWTKCSFHRLPFRNRDVLKLWLVVLKMDPDTEVRALKRADHRVCSAHFAPEDFFPAKELKEGQKGQRLYLRKNAVPMVAEGTTDTVESRMCSVVGCDSGSRGAQRFKLPEDPETRLEWVQFLFEVNRQRLKESSCADINICIEHFTDDCFASVNQSGKVQLKPSAAPSVCIKSETEEPLESPHVEPVESMHFAGQRDDLNTCNSPSSRPKKSKKKKFKGSRAGLKSGGVSGSHAAVASADSKEKEAEMKRRYVVNEKCLLQLFRRKCLSCGSKLQMEKVTCGELTVVKQQCLRCVYRFEWKSQVNASLPTAEVTPETQQEMPADDHASSAVFSEMITFSDEDSAPSDEGEEGDDGQASSGGEWNPTEDILLREELTNELEEESEDEEESGEEDLDLESGLKINELCTECGRFFNILKLHTCEHKRKPHSCNICGKRCVTEISLKIHSRIHDKTYEHPCKYCHTTFKTRLDKCKHEQIHLDCKDPYKCPDCPETFATNKARRVHLAIHRANHPKEFKCGVCGIEFKDVHHLRRHSVVHTGLKPYKCSVCDRGFNQASHLKSHMRVHTGEKPYKCQHCDCSFNHNVSLKSHVERHHSSTSGRERKKGKAKGGPSDAAGVENSGNEKGTDSEFDNVGEEQDTEEEAREETAEQPKSMRSTGRPRGRPKRNAAGGSALAGGKKGRRSNTKTAKSASSDEGSEDEQWDSNASCDSGEESEETETKWRSRGKSRGRPANDSDSDFDPEG